MITLDLIIPSAEEVERVVVEESAKGNMIVPIVVALVVVAIAIVIVSKVIISNGLKGAK